LDLIERGAAIFDKLIVAIAQTWRRTAVRRQRARGHARGGHLQLENVEVDVFDGLLMDYAREKNALVVLRASAPSPTTNTSCKWL